MARSNGPRCLRPCTAGLPCPRRRFRRFAPHPFPQSREPKEEVLAELSHTPLAILAVTLGWSRWLELRLPAENQSRNAMARLWPLCLVLIGVVLLNYREM